MSRNQEKKMFSRTIKGIVGAMALALFAVGAEASITYSIDRTIGVGTVDGTITTDGTLGVLTSANILSWTMTITHPNLSSGSPYSTSSSNPNSIAAIYGNALTATANDLFFDYGSTGYGYFYLYDYTSYWCNITSGTGGCGSSTLIGAESIGWMVNTSLPFDQSHQSNVAIASTEVPEPASLALLGLGIAGLAGIRRRNKV